MEEKYEKALLKARVAKQNTESAVTIGILEEIFPELKESEDERIKEAIIATIHLYYGEPLEDEAKDMIAWVEKQGQKSAWSEEDKNLMYDTLSNLTELKDRYGEGYGNVKNCIDWLKSFKERIGG